MELFEGCVVEVVSKPCCDSPLGTYLVTTQQYDPEGRWLGNRLQGVGTYYFCKECATVRYASYDVYLKLKKGGLV